MRDGGDGIFLELTGQSIFDVEKSYDVKCVKIKQTNISFFHSFCFFLLFSNTGDL